MKVNRLLNYESGEGSMKSSGKIRQFSSGAVRDSAEGKSRMGLLPLDLLERVAVLYGEGANKYGDNNWRLGQPKSAVFDSMMRHITKYSMDMTDEDHLSAIIWNALSLMNVDMYYSDNPDLNDMKLFTDGKLKVGDSSE
jgi:hypothetical protein